MKISINYIFYLYNNKLVLLEGQFYGQDIPIDYGDSIHQHIKLQKPNKTLYQPNPISFLYYITGKFAIDEEIFSGDIEDIESKNEDELNGKKVKELEEKVLRTLAEMENQRRRFEKEREEAFEFGGFAFAKESLALIDTLERAKASFTNNKKFEENKDFLKILETFEILEKDLIAIFKRNNIEQVICMNKNLIQIFTRQCLK